MAGPASQRIAPGAELKGGGGLLSKACGVGGESEFRGQDRDHLGSLRDRGPASVPLAQVGPEGRAEGLAFVGSRCRA